MESGNEHAASQVRNKLWSTRAKLFMEATAHLAAILDNTVSSVGAVSYEVAWEQQHSVHVQHGRCVLCACFPTLQAAQKALQYQPHMVRALWLHSQCLRDPLSRLCELQKLQAVDRSWPGLNAALATAASECLAEASSGDEDEGCGSPCAFYPAGPGRRTTQTASIPMTRRCMDNAGKLRHELDQAYALLGLQPGVHLSKDDVGRAYRRAAAQVHPDAARVRAGVDAAGNGNGNSEQFIALRQAFELLSSTV